MMKIVSWNVFTTTAVVKHWGNSCEVSTAAGENLCEGNTAASYQED